MASRGTERPLGEVFDSVTEDYDRVRQGYPPVLMDAAILRGGLASGSRVLEVGCGTGKLTELLAARQLNVDAVDPGGCDLPRHDHRADGRRTSCSLSYNLATSRSSRPTDVRSKSTTGS